MIEDILFEEKYGSYEITAYNLDTGYYLTTFKVDEYELRKYECCLGHFIKNDFSLFPYTFVPNFNAYQRIKDLNTSFDSYYLYFVDRDDFHEYIIKIGKEIENYYLFIG